MKIISGLLKGRILKGFDIDGTRPTQDRVKESVFSIIQNDIRDGVVLDLFAGTGNLGIESLSNYSKFCYFVDKNKISCNIIKENIKGLDNYKIINSDYKDALNYFSDNKIKFDIIFLDPPYKDKFIGGIITSVLDKDLINPDGLIICEAEIIDFDNDYNNLELIKAKKYGYKYVYIYRKKDIYE